jgi:hypothetical protein
MLNGCITGPRWERPSLFIIDESGRKTDDGFSHD